MAKQPIVSQKLSPAELNVFSTKTGLVTIPDWAWERVLRPEDLDDYYFYKRSPKARAIMEVNLDQVVGTAHDKYNRSSWVDMIINLNKPAIDSFEKANEAFDSPVGELPEYFKYGNQYFIAGQGNHRTSIAKVGGRKWVKVWVNDYVLDQELKEVILFLNKYFEIVNDDGFKSKSYFQLRSHTVWMSGDRQEIEAFHRYFKVLPVERGKGNLLNRISLFLWFRSYLPCDDHILNLRWKESMRSERDLREKLIVLKSPKK